MVKDSRAPLISQHSHNCDYRVRHSWKDKGSSLSKNDHLQNGVI